MTFYEIKTHLFDGCWESLSWVLRLCGGQTNQFRARKRESCCYKGTTQALEAVVECSWIVPQLEAHITCIGTALAIDAAHDVDQDPEEAAIQIRTKIVVLASRHSHVSDHCGHLDDGEDKFRFTVAFDAEEVDGHNEYQEYRYPGGVQGLILNLFASPSARCFFLL